MSKRILLFDKKVAKVGNICKTTNKTQAKVIFKNKDKLCQLISNLASLRPPRDNPI